MSHSISCEQCGQAYQPSSLLHGQCPACLLSQVLPEGRGPSADQAARFVPPRIETLALLFPQLQILELAGCGGMSAVYKALQTHLGRNVAIKILPQEIAATAGGVERFHREAKTLGQLNHPNIVQVYDAGQAGPWCYIMMEYVSGPNLRQFMGESKLPSAEVIKIASSICDGLQYAHDQGIVHRDIKPENVLLSNEGEVKLVDFGLAKLLKNTTANAAASRTGQVLGTPHYLAPEQIETPATVDHRADVYSLGVLIYEMLTGELPLGHFQPPSQRIGSDPALDAVVLQAMAKDRLHRYQQVRNLKKQMTDRSPKQRLQPSAIDQTARPFRWSQLGNELLLSGCTLFAMFVGVGALFNGLDSFAPIDSLAGHQRGTPVLPGPLLVLMGVCGLLLSVVFARLNIASKSSWGDVSWSQYPSFAVLVSAYVALGASLLVGPGIAVMLLGLLPLFAELESWNLFGKGFAEAERVSLLTPYWLRIYGVSLLTSTAWCIPFAILLRKHPSLIGDLFYPTTREYCVGIARIVSLLAAVTCIPLGMALLFASWLAKRP